jgi:hypothetical protein
VPVHLVPVLKHGMCIAHGQSACPADDGHGLHAGSPQLAVFVRKAPVLRTVASQSKPGSATYAGTTSCLNCRPSDRRPCILG